MKTELILDDWRTINTAPQTGIWFIAKDNSGKEHRVHFACDLSGEEQPAFRGFFEYSLSDSFIQVENLTHWKPEP